MFEGGRSLPGVLSASYWPEQFHTAPASHRGGRSSIFCFLASVVEESKAQVAQNMNVQCGAQQTYSAKGKIVNILGFMGHVVCYKYKNLLVNHGSSRVEVYGSSHIKCAYVPIQPYLQNKGSFGFGLWAIVCCPVLVIHLILQSQSMNGPRFKPDYTTPKSMLQPARIFKQR